MDAHRRSDRYFILFSPPPGSDHPPHNSHSISTGGGGGGGSAGLVLSTGDLDSNELQEDDIFSTSAGGGSGDSGSGSEPKPIMISRTRSMTNPGGGGGGGGSHRRHISHPEQPSGILGLLHEKPASASTTSLHRKATIASATTATARMIPAPKLKVKEEFSVHCKSAPMNIPVGPPRKPRGKSWLAGGGAEEEEDEEFTNTGPEMLPPHEIVARKEANTPLTSSSCFEGIGRTLKGRDLRMVRNAVWRQTGFLD
ncbi:hypothetical protein LUZ60_007447 [Juncus effusus]|nr:hypothetical protein LUZ60_007447 [Juncus effusus]